MTDEPSSARKAPDADPERTVLAPTTPGSGQHRSQILTQPHVDIELPPTGTAPTGADPSAPAPDSAPADVPVSGPVSIPDSGTPVTTVPKNAPRAGAPSSNVLPVGTRLAEFEVISVIGEGGFGIVYRAVDHSLRRIVALKEYMPAALASRLPDFSVSIKSAQHAETFRAGLRSFINEARLLARFDHQALVKVYRFWEANGTAYMVMPMYEGGTLKQVLKQRGRPADEAWLRQLLGPLLDAVELLHKAECLHRDIAPDNVILVGGDASPLRPVLLDFGAARRVITEHTQALTVILKPGFAPIEQYDEIPGMKQGPWTDLYALAAVLHYAMVGKPPPPSVGRMLNDSQVPLVETMRGRYSEVFLAAIDRALEPRPDARPRNVAEFRALLSAPPAVAAAPSGPVAAAPELRGSLVSDDTDSTVQASTVPVSPVPVSPPPAAAPAVPRAAEPAPPVLPDDSNEPTLPATDPRLRPAASAVPSAPRPDEVPATKSRSAAPTEPGTSIESLAARWKQHVGKPAGTGAAKPAHVYGERSEERPVERPGVRPAERPGERPDQPAGKLFAPTAATVAATVSGTSADETLRAMLEGTRRDARAPAPAATAAPAAAAGTPKKLPPWVTPEPTVQPAAPPRRSGAKWFVAGMGLLALGAAAFVLVVPRFGQQQPAATVTPATNAPGVPPGTSPMTAPAPSVAMPAPPPPAAASVPPPSSVSPPPPPMSAPPSTASSAAPGSMAAAAPTSPPVSASPEKVIPPKKKPVPPPGNQPVKAAPVTKTAPVAGSDGDAAASPGRPQRPEWMQRAMREARECLVARDFACTIQRAETVLASDPDHPAAQRLLKLARQGQEAALSGDWKMR